MLIVIAQLAVAYLIELLGIFGVEKQPFQWRRLIGMAVAIAGIVIFKWEKITLYSEWEFVTMRVTRKRWLCKNLRDFTGNCVKR